MDARTDLLTRLQWWRKTYREQRLRLIRFRGRKAEMEKRKAKEYIEAYSLSIEDVLLNLHNIRGHLRLIADLLGMKEAS